MAELLDQFNEKIDLFLAECSAENTPTVCNLISTASGKQKVRELIQKIVIKKKVTIAQAVVEIEMEFNPNSYTE